MRVRVGVAGAVDVAVGVRVGGKVGDATARANLVGAGVSVGAGVAVAQADNTSAAKKTITRARIRIPLDFATHLCGVSHVTFLQRPRHLRQPARVIRVVALGAGQMMCEQLPRHDGDERR